MKPAPIRGTHRVAAHPTWCTCRTCEPPHPSSRRWRSRPRRRSPAAMLVAGTVAFLLGLASAGLPLGFLVGLDR